jgi:hypothetical protein
MTKDSLNMLSFAAALATSFGLMSPQVQAATMESALGQAVAAVLIADSCKNIGLIGGNEYEKAAADLLATQGLKRGAVLKNLYYGKTEWLHELAEKELNDRGVSKKDKGALCAFGKSVAARDDAIGQFLLKGAD